MLPELERRHGELLAHMRTMTGLIAQDERPAEAVTRTRLALGRTSSARTTFLVTTVYPALIARLGETDAGRVRQLRNDAAADRARSSAHVAKWSAGALAADWTGFRRDSRGILAMMATRIERERAVLYPLLGGHAESTARITVDSANAV